MASGKIFLVRCIHRCLSFIPFFPPTSVSILCTICVYVHVSDCVQTVYELPMLPNNNTAKYF